MIVHELSIDAEMGESVTVLELEGRERLAVLQAVRAPLDPLWSCKVFVRLEYFPLTEEALHTKNPLGSGDDVNYTLGFDHPSHSGA